jgi:hypothetical protein
MNNKNAKDWRPKTCPVEKQTRQVSSYPNPSPGAFYAKIANWL